MDLAPDFDEFCELLLARHVEFVVEMGVPPVQIHVMSHIDGVSWDEVWQTHQRGPLGPHEVPFIGREAFLRNKRAAGRPQDLADVDALREPGA